MNKADTDDGMGPQAGVPPLQDELEKRRNKAEKLEEVGMLLRSLLTWQLVQVGTSRSRLTVGEKAPHKEFLKKGGLKKPQRYWPGTVALYKICQYQMSNELLICKCPFMCLICEIAQECGRYDLHFQVHMVMALQNVAEYYLTSLSEDANLCTIHTKCITIMPKDI